MFYIFLLYVFFQFTFQEYILVTIKFTGKDGKDEFFLSFFIPSFLLRVRSKIHNSNSTFMHDMPGFQCPYKTGAYSNNKQSTASAPPGYVKRPWVAYMCIA